MISYDYGEYTIIYCKSEKKWICETVWGMFTASQAIQIEKMIDNEKEKSFQEFEAITYDMFSEDRPIKTVTVKGYSAKDEIFFCQFENGNYKKVKKEQLIKMTPEIKKKCIVFNDLLKEREDSYKKISFKIHLVRDDIRKIDERNEKLELFSQYLKKNKNPLSDSTGETGTF